MADTELRGHELKVYKPQVHLDININTTRSPYGTIMNNPYRLLSDTSSSSSFLSNWKSFICVINNSDCKYFFSVRIVDAWNNLPDAVLRCNTVEELLMHGIIYRMQFYVATLLKISKENLTVFSRIGDTNKLSVFSPCMPLTLVGGSLS